VSPLVPLLVLVPVATAAAGLVVGRRRVLARILAVTGPAVALLVAVAAAWEVGVDGPRVDVWSVVPTGWVPIAVATRADALGLTVAIMVATVALAVQLYSTAYLREDPRYPSYAALVSLFTAAMLLVVVADDLVVLLVGWEVMGLCSYALIGHHWELAEARAAAVKAFVVTRLGDVGLLFGIFVLGDLAGSFQVSRIAVEVPELAGATLTVGLLLVLLGVVGKSAQVPLHVWLPDAMVGPTPVSALIHAATMVAAGVFLVARLYDAFLASPSALAVLAVLASVTMLGAALAALAQDDLKRVLAWSTSSQLAYMLGGLAVGGYTAGLFHLLAHAAFKALLFLAAGAVIHAVGTNLMAGMGGLGRRMPLTAWTAGIGLLALAGVPPLAGFVSKESILRAAEEAALHGGPLPAWAAWAVLVAGLATVLVTAAYVTRAWTLTFAGPDRTAAGTRPHDPPRAMAVPLVALAVPTVGLGVLALVPDVIASALDRAVDADGAAGPPAAAVADPGVGLTPATAVLSLLLVAVGAGLVLAERSRLRGGDPAASLGRLRRVLADGFGVDAAYDAVVVRPVRAAARLVVAGDSQVVHAYVTGAGRAARGLGGLVHRAQTGRVQGYLAVVLAVVVLLVVAGVVLA
jgi:NADH-quinone oxidoreductase subunit L